MIEYEINEDQRIVMCRISGEEIQKSAINVLQKMSGSLLNTDKLLLKNEYIGIAKYNPSEEKSFSIDIGKEISRKKAFAKYNKDMHKKIRQFKEDITKLNEKLLVLCFKYEYLENEINEKVKRY